jgi:peptide/nickel transport system permease protein
VNAQAGILARVRSPRRRARAGSADPGLGTLGRAAGVVLAVFAVLAVFGPLIAPHDPASLDLANAYGSPSAGHPLGFDQQGRDILSRTLAGAQLSFAGPLAITLLATSLGALVAVASAWRGGFVDSALGSILDLLFAFPAVLLAILAVALFGKGITAAVIALAIAYTPYTARLLRAAALRERALSYVDALSVQGLSGFAICLRHLLPNLGPLIVAQATLTFGYAMVDLAAISFLGLGAQEPSVDWGLMVGEGKTAILERHPREALVPGFCLILAVTAFNVLGERLSERAERRAAAAAGAA